MELYIDTTEQGVIKLQLYSGEKVIGKSRKQTLKISESLLPEIEKLLKKHGVKFADLKKISVNPGPGGFSSTRTGVATANALNYALGVNKIVLSVYDKEPNITKAKLLPLMRGRQRGGRRIRINKTSPKPSSQPMPEASAGTARGGG